MPGMSLPFGRDLAIRHLGLGHRLEHAAAENSSLLSPVVLESDVAAFFGLFCQRSEICTVYEVDCGNSH
jgi:hypothetical protein